MTIMKRIAAALLGVLIMTAPNINTGGLDLPAAIAEVPVSSVIARTGIVSDILESDNITVKISGSDVLVQASYLFPQYQPVLGDIVYVAKQDAQWIVLGTMSGPLNTLIANPSFESGVVGTTPDNWSISAVSSVAGVITFTKQPLSAVAGVNIGVIRNSSAGVAGTSSADIFSSIAVAQPGSRWGLGYFITYAVPDVNAALVPQGGFMDLDTYIQFLDVDGVLISETSANYTPIYSSVIAPVYQRTFTPTAATSITAPPLTASARIRMRVRMTMHVNSASEIGLDVMLLRSVG